MFLSFEHTAETTLMTMQQQQTKPPIFTARRVLKILAIICFIICFCPTFLVSCSGTSSDVTSLDVSFGITYQGQQITDPHPIALLTIFIPITIFIILFLKKMNDKKRALIVTIATVIDIILWIAMYVGVKKFAEENYCVFKTTGWYLLNMLCLVAMAVLGFLVFKQILYFDGDLLKSGTTQMAKSALNQVTKSVSKAASDLSKAAAKIPQEDIIGYCNKCGFPITKDASFCNKCGTSVRSLGLKIEEPEEASNVQPEAPAKPEPKVPEATTTDSIDDIFETDTKKEAD